MIRIRQRCHKPVQIISVQSLVGLPDNHCYDLRPISAVVLSLSRLRFRTARLIYDGGNVRNRDKIYDPGRRDWEFPPSN